MSLDDAHIGGFNKNQKLSRYEHNEKRNVLIPLSREDIEAIAFVIQNRKGRGSIRDRRKYIVSLIQRDLEERGAYATVRTRKEI